MTASTSEEAATALSLASTDKQGSTFASPIVSLWFYAFVYRNSEDKSRTQKLMCFSDGKLCEKKNNGKTSGMTRPSNFLQRHNNGSIVLIKIICSWIPNCVDMKTNEIEKLPEQLCYYVIKQTCIWMEAGTYHFEVETSKTWPREIFFLLGEIFSQPS